MAESPVMSRFVWHELMTSDTTAAIAFYPKVVGWKTQAWEKDASYVMWVAPTGPSGGLMSLPEEAKAGGVPPCWSVYVGTSDIQATVQKALQLGGRVLKGVTQIPGAGQFAVLADPQGAVFCLHASGMPAGEDRQPQPGEFSWHELVTTDHVAAFKFYQELFGWENVGAQDMGPMGIYQMFGWGGHRVGGMFNKPLEMNAPPHWLCYVLVDDVKAVAEAAKAAGGTVVHGPAEVPGGDWIAQITDPQGAMFAVHARKKAVADVPAPAASPAPKPATKPKAKKVTPAKKSTAAKKMTAAKKAAIAKKPARTQAARKAKTAKPAKKAAPATKRRAVKKSGPKKKAAPARKALKKSTPKKKAAPARKAGRKTASRKRRR